MKIFFITSVLEEHKDAVGDYTRDLANVITEQSHHCFLAGLNSETEKSIPEDGDSGDERPIDELHLPVNLPMEERLKKIAAAAAHFDPDWISLQFVCYSFGNRGIIREFSRLFPRHFARYKVQIMFHEIWIGEKPGCGLKQRLVGMAQKHYIKKMCHALKTRMYHTSNAVYQTVLGRENLTAKRLPLFGNFPLLQEAPPLDTFKEFSWANDSNPEFDRSQSWIFGLWGSIYQDWDPAPFIKALQTVKQRHQKRIVLCSAGRTGSGRELWQQLQATYGEEFTFVTLGELSSEQSVVFLHHIDFGVAQTPFDLLGKSGAAIAMLEQGLPVIAVRDNRETRLPVSADSISSQVYRFDSTRPEQLAEDIVMLKKIKPYSHKDEIVRGFIADLERGASL